MTASPIATRQSPWTELRPGVHRLVAEPAAVNVGLVHGPEAVVLIDCGSTPAQGRAIAASARELVGQPVTHVVITHDHWDHFWGLAGVIADSAAQGIDLISIGHTSLTPPTPEVDGAADQATKLGFELAELAPISHPVNLAKGINVGEGRRIEAVHLGPAHTPGDLVVVVQGAGVSFTGDVYETSAPPSFGPDSTVENWPMVLDIALAGAKDETLIVPGHGDPTGPFPAFQQRAEISMIYGAAERLVAKGIRLEQALEALDAPLREDGSVHPGALEYEWPFDVPTIKNALPLAYAELQAKGEVPRTQLKLA